MWKYLLVSFKLNIKLSKLKVMSTAIYYLRELTLISVPTFMLFKFKIMVKLSIQYLILVNTIRCQKQISCSAFSYSSSPSKNWLLALFTTSVFKCFYGQRSTLFYLTPNPLTHSLTHFFLLQTLWQALHHTQNSLLL